MTAPATADHRDAADEGGNGAVDRHFTVRTRAGLTWPLRYIATCLVMAAFCFNTDAGRIVPDTKLDLTIDPGRFLGRALHIWDGQGFAGQLQNQAYGYLFPMGPFFVLGHLAHLQMWAVQRLWWTGLLCVAFVGMAKLAAVLGIGTPASRFTAALAYSLSPHVLTVLGPVSAEALPMCVLPWVLIPLIKASAGGSVRRGALLSAVAVLCMGGANAALDLAALAPVLLWFLTRRPSRRILSLFAWWFLASCAATLWWVVPLLLLGRYSPPFLDYIESGATTTSITSTVQALRGTADWVAYIPASGWRAGAILLTSPAVILNSVIVVAAGLAGLALRDLGERNWLVLCLLVGAVMVCFGHIAPVDGFWAGDLRSVLDGPLAPLRNLHKFDVMLRLPLALGLAHLVGRLRWGRRPADVRLSRAVVGAIAAVAVAGTATPLLSLQVAAQGSFVGLPGYWTDAANWLGAHDSGRALIVPGSHTGLYLWGRPADEPIQALAKSEWEVRDGVPLVGTGHIRQMDAVEQLFDSGAGSDQLASYLAQSGVTTLVVRNDLAYTAVGAPRPILVHQTIDSSPGFTREATFGADLGDPSVAQDSGLQEPYPALEIYSVAGAPAKGVDAHLASSVNLVSGGPESLLPLPTQDTSAGAPSVLAGDDGSYQPAGPVVLTDGLRRRDTSFGRNPPNSSATLGADDNGTIPAAARDYLPYPGTEHQSVAQLIGARSIDASSSASDASAGVGPVPGYDPFGAVDDDPSTQWRSDSSTTPIGQWFELRLLAPTAVPYLDLTMAPTGARVGQVRIDTDRGSVTAAVTEGHSTRIHLSGAKVSYVRVTVTAAAALFVRQVGISTLRIPGVRVSRTIRVADDLPSGRPVDVISFAAPADGRDGCVAASSGPLCSPYLVRPGEDDAGIDRTFLLGQKAAYRWQMTVIPKAGTALNALLARTVQPTLRVTASTTAVADPDASAQAAADGDTATGWIASANETVPKLTVRWSPPHRVSSLRLIVGKRLAATPPTAVTVDVGRRRIPASVAADGTVTFPAVRTDRLTLELSNPAGLWQTFDPDLGFYVSLGIGVSEVQIPGLSADSPAAPAERQVHLACGEGPQTTIDGHAVRTSVDTTIGALRDLARVPVTLCGGSQVLDALRAGVHRVGATSSQLWIPIAMSAQRITSTPPSGSGVVRTTVASWATTDRRVDVAERSGPTVLRVFENANPGWTATLGGKRLAAVTLDGWQQGYVLPAGPAASVHLVYRPDRTYRTVLLAGAIAVLALLVSCLIVIRRSDPSHDRRAVPPDDPSLLRRTRWLLPLAGGVAAGLLAGWWGLGAFAVSGAAAMTVGRLVRTDSGSAWVQRFWAAAAAALYLVPGLVIVVVRVGSAGYATTSGVVEVGVVAALTAVTWSSIATGPSEARGGPGAFVGPGLGRTRRRSRAAGRSTTR